MLHAFSLDFSVSLYLFRCLPQEARHAQAVEYLLQQPDSITTDDVSDSTKMS